jgi:hypothetical protein
MSRIVIVILIYHHHKPIVICFADLQLGKFLSIIVVLFPLFSKLSLLTRDLSVVINSLSSVAVNNESFI